MSNGTATTSSQRELPRFLRFSPWTLTPFLAAGLAIFLEYLGFWSFLRAFHPLVLGVIAVGLSLWLLLALVPKVTVHTMRGLDIALPRGDSAVPAVGMLLRILTVLASPTLIYLALMALREETARGWDLVSAGFVGLVLGAVGWRSVTLLDIMRNTYPEDEIRKGLLDTGVYSDEAIRKLKAVTAEIMAEASFDRKRIRLRRLAATDRVLRNKNYDPHQAEHGTTTSATIGGLERERHVAWAKRSRDKVELQADLADQEVRAKIAEQEAKKRQFDSQFQSRRRRGGKSLEEELRGKLSDRIELEEARDQIVKEKREEMEKVGVPPQEIARRMSLLKAELAEIIARIMSEE